MPSWIQYIIEQAKVYWFRYILVSLLLALVSGFWFEWREEQASAVKRIESSYQQLEPTEKAWLNLSSTVFSAGARPGAQYPDRESLLPLYNAIKNTLDEVTSFYAPTGKIETSARIYKNALEDVAGAINLYEPSPHGMARLLNALQTASNVGGSFKSNIDKYRTESWRSFLSVII